MTDVLAQLWHQGWIDAIARGAVLTVVIGVVSVVVGIGIGIVGGLIKWKALFPFDLVVDCYTTVVRGVPELLVIYLLFFSSTDAVFKITSSFGYTDRGGSAYPFIIGVVSIGIISGSYSVEVMRGALAAISRGQVEAASALGLMKSRIFYRIIAPQMLRIAIPGVNNVWQTTMKDTALISVIGMQELMRTSALGAGSTRQPVFFYGIAAMVYFCITLVSQALFGALERALNRHTIRAT